MTEEVVIQGDINTSAQPLIDVDPPKPASAAEEQKTDDKPAPGAEAQKPETPEQQEAKLSRRQRAIERATRDERDARIRAETELRITKEQLAAREVKPADTEPKRDDIDPATGEQYDYETFLRRVTRWEARQVSSEERKAEREANQGRETQAKQAETESQRAKAYYDRRDAYIKATPSFEGDISDYAEDFAKLGGPLMDFIFDSDVGPKLLHHLATNADVHDRIAGLSPLRQVAELGKIEEKLTPAATAGAEPAPERKTTKAPAPITPVNQGRSTSTGFREGMSQSEFRAWAVKESGGKAKWIRN